ncbi:MAG: hypothetical protein KF905_00295 [Flavobacteriales bacterium]|nr:hypothetical protein [Flavobacteriales bacterium]
MKRWFLIAFTNLLIAAIMGALLRGQFIGEIPFLRFRPWMHAHSHVAMLGWLFTGIVVVLSHDGGRDILTRGMHRMLVVLQVAVVGMLLSFPVQGYGAASISASTLHMVVSYFVLAHLWRQSLAWPREGSGRLTRWSIILYFLSTLGVWAMAPLIATGNQGKEIYYWAIQFYLHFQFNGWFWFAALALGVRWAERQGFELHLDRLTLGLWIVSAVLTYALAIAWSEPHPAVFATVSVGVLLQVWAALRSLRILRRLQRRAHERFPTWGKVLVGVALVGMAMKVLVQAAVAAPSMAVMAFTLRSYVMGFIHLNTLAIMTTLLLVYALLQGWLPVRNLAAKAGVALLTGGIILSELLLFTQGTFFWMGWGLIQGHYLHMVIASALMPLGVALLLWAGFRDRTHALGRSSPAPRA